MRKLLGPGSIWKLKNYCQTCKYPFLKRLCILFYNFYQAQNGSSIAWNAEFAGEPCFPHGMKSIFVSGAARVGTNCVIFQQVTIDSNTLPDSKRVGAPTIGDNCYIAAGAKIVGGVRVGDNVRVGANAVVYKDIPDNSVVVVGEQRVIKRQKAPDNRYYSYKSGWKYFDDGAWKPVEDEEVAARLAQV